MRAVPIHNQSEGINLLRSKGGSSPDALFDLVNGWVTPKRTINARPGSVNEASAPGTVGGVGFEDKIHVFAATPVSVSDPLIVVNVLRHPTGGAAGLLKIHRAFPFFGRLYVVAEFTDGVVQHYWLEKPNAWEASKQYAYKSLIQPPTATGYFYENITLDATPAWQSGIEVTVGEFRQPRVSNGFKYELMSATGPAPARTSNTEPTWPTVDGATVTERLYVTDGSAPPGGTTTTPPPGDGGGGGGGSTGDEYGPFPPVGDEDPK